MNGTNGVNGTNGRDDFGGDAFRDNVFDEDAHDEDIFDEAPYDAGEFGADRLEEELRQAAAVLDPPPAQLEQIAVEAYALHDLDARVAELTFDSLVDAIPVRGATEPPRMLTFRAGETTVDVEVTSQGLMGQLLPPRPARIEVLAGPHAGAELATDDLGRFTGEAPPPGPFALRLRTGGEVVVTEWLRA
ncbi:hypothetical protein [Streptomyces bullii]|uniref:Carboxypeptidase regulatory-like domain-containing protein n=1 Tax=Streptomyces bullii TaxID=349910 RepID=A0ABW0UZ46_9ACTN